MNISRFSVLFILMHTISICHSLHSLSVSKKRPRASNCWVLGQYVNYCSDKFASIDQFPKECLSYFWSSFIVENDFSISHFYGRGSEVVLNQLLLTEKDIYVSYQYIDTDNFFLTISNCVTNNKNITKEMNNLQAFLDQYKNLAGLTLALDITNTTSLPENFSTNFKSYLNILKCSLPETMKIGIGLKAGYFELVTKSSENPIEGIQFEEINHLVNYYVINTYKLNSKCTSGFISGGLSPVDGKADHTMKRLHGLVNSVGIPNYKLLYRIFTSPNHENNDTICSQNYRQLCTHPDLAKEWCADTLDTFYEKGEFINKHANGFIACYVDTDDPHCNCECCTPFPAFYAILNGYHGNPSPPNCPMFNRM